MAHDVGGLASSAFCDGPPISLEWRRTGMLAVDAPGKSAKTLIDLNVKC